MEHARNGSKTRKKVRFRTDQEPHQPELPGRRITGKGLDTLGISSLKDHSLMSGEGLGRGKNRGKDVSKKAGAWQTT